MPLLGLAGVYIYGSEPPPMHSCAAHPTSLSYVWKFITYPLSLLHLYPPVCPFLQSHTFFINKNRTAVMPHSRSILAFLSLFFLGLKDLAAAEDCSCYQTDTGDTFSSYKFLDFRNGKPADFDKYFTNLQGDFRPKEEYVYNYMTKDNINFGRKPTVTSW